MTETDEKWSVEDILATVHAMQKKVSANCDTLVLESQFRDFKARYPGLYSKASKSMTKSDWDILKVMLEQLNKIEANEIDSYDSSVCVGQDLVDRFVTPRLASKSK